MKKNLRSRELCDKNFLGRVQLTSMVGKPKSITLIRQKKNRNVKNAPQGKKMIKDGEDQCHNFIHCKVGEKNFWFVKHPSSLL